MIGEAAEEQYYSIIVFPENAGIDGTEGIGARESLGESRATPIIVHLSYEPKAGEHTL